MKFHLRNMIILIFMTILLVAALPVQGTGSELLRIGLYYGTDTLSSANLENNTGYGQGFRFGYYADDLTFIELGRTDSSVNKVTVIRTSNYYLSGTTYSMTSTSGTAIGCYHISVASGISTFAEARQLADSYDGGFVAWISGQYEVRIGAYTTKDEALAAQTNLGLTDGTICGTTSYAMNIMTTGSSQILFQYDGGLDSALGIYPDVAGAEEIRTWFKGYL